VRGRRVFLAAAAGAVLLFGVLGVMGLSGTTPATQPAASRPVGDSEARRADKGPSFAIRAKAVYPVTAAQRGPIENGMIIVRGGRIAAVGIDLEVPSDLPLIDLRDEVVCPGFVSAGSGMAGRHPGAESVSGAYEAVDAFDRYGDFAAQLACGTTTVHLDPGDHRLVSGVGAVVKLAGPPGERVLVPAADLTITLGVFGPPPLVERPFYASSDVPIEPATAQRPGSRLGQFLELEERIALLTSWMVDPAALAESDFDVHARRLMEHWAAGLPLRIQVRRAADIEGALGFVRRHGRPAYLVGLTEADRLSAALVEAGLPAVVRVDERYRAPAADLGDNPDVLEPRLDTAAGLVAAADDAGPRGGHRDWRVALAGRRDDGVEDLQMVGALAMRGGIPADRALAAITRVPAEILGIANRVGSLVPGKDADLVVLSGRPLEVSSHVRRVYVGGRLVHEPEASDTIVIKAGAVWVGDGRVLRDAAVLIEGGKIQAVGQRVPHPRSARVIDAGPDGFLSPGFIDAQGHLGLKGDRSAVTPDVPIHRVVGAAGRACRRVARAGVTTVLLGPYRGATNGARVAAIKTYGVDRDALVARELSGVRFSLRGKDPLTGIVPLRKALGKGKQYDEKWKKYEKELADWKTGKPKKDGEAAAKVEKVVEKTAGDPISGTWEYTLAGEPLPEPVSGTIKLRLVGTVIEGRMSDPTSGETADVSGTLDGKDVTLEIEVETPVGKPSVRATLDREDHMIGTLTVASFEISIEATRTDKGPVEFKIRHRRRRAKDGRPTPPKVDEALEPLRPLLAGKIPAVVEVETAAQVRAALKLFVDEFNVPLVLLGAEGAAVIADDLLKCKEQVGVVVPPSLTWTRARRSYTQVVDLSRRGIRVALQSDREDGARSLPLMGLYAVREGLGGDAALRALTIDAARMYKLDDRLGSLEVGKDGDVLVFTGHPFDAGSRLERVIVAGREVPDEE